MVPVKSCTKCNVEKSLLEFVPNKKMFSRVGSWCRDCLNAHNRQVYNLEVEPRAYTKWEDYVREDPDRANRRRYTIQKKYGLTIQEFVDMLDQQDHKCGLCAKPISEIDSRKWAIDHDHSTGKVRGILCYGCNGKLGGYERLRDEVGFDAVEDWIGRGKIP